MKTLLLYTLSVISCLSVLILEAGSDDKCVKFFIVAYWTVEGMDSFKIFGGIRIMFEIIQHAIYDIGGFTKVLFIFIMSFSLLNFIVLSKKIGACK